MLAQHWLRDIAYIGKIVTKETEPATFWLLDIRWPDINWQTVLDSGPHGFKLAEDYNISMVGTGELNVKQKVRLKLR